MARYIDADALKTAILMKYRANWEIPCSSEDRLIQRVVTDLRVLIEKSITADVAPKSEVEELKGELAIAERHEKDARALFKDAVIQLQNARQEVAREIFEEIEKIVDNNTYKSYLPNSSLWCKEYKSNQIIVDIAELKKKYMEVENGT